ncbi:MAG TPA: PAS domain S-box protein [Planctomycetes bacterium]|nr:PAS domain S-box protein [Fuerstiella sp.]HIK95868.1 PAS domain S-box protein [Planctomycetota bacterium]
MNVDLQQQVEELQRQLADSESRLRAFLSFSQELFFCLEFDPPVPTHLPAKDQAAMMLSARVADCNAAFAELCDVSEPDQLTGSRYVSLVGTASSTLIERALRFVRSGYCVNEVHNTDTLRDGAVRHFISSSRGEIQGGHLVRGWITFRDVTHQTLIEAASQQGEAALRRTAEQLDSAFWIMDWHNFKSLYSGPAIEQRWGISPQQLLDDPMCWLERIHEHDRQRVRDAFLTHAATGGFDETFRVNLPDGSVNWVRDRCFPVPGTTDDQLRVVGLVQDVSELRRAQTGLSSLFKVSTEMLFVMDVNGCLQEVNPGMAQALGYDSEELNQISLLDLLHVDQQSAGRQVLSRLASGKPAVEMNSQFLRKDGSVCHVEWNASPAGDAGLIYAAARDISSELTEQDRRGRQDAAAARLDRLSPRERQILEMVVTGKASKVIAHELDLSKRTVETHRANLMKKLKLSTTAELIRLSLQAAD